MTHGIITLMARSLRLETRLLRTHLFRLVFVFFIYLMMLGAQFQSLMVGAPGLHFFANMLWLNAMFITLGGVSFFASAITEEKEENTLGLLMMTGLSPVGILFGKSTARMLQAILLLTVQFPFTLLAVTLGGVLMNQVLAAYAALLAFTVMLSNLSLFWSVVAKRTGTAAAATTLCLLFYSLAPLAVTELVNLVNAQTWGGTVYGQAAVAVVQGIRDASVYHRLYAVTQTGFDDPVIGFQVVSNLVAGMVLFLMSWALFGTFALHADVAGMTRSIFSRPTSRTRWFAPGRAWGNPLIWKDYFFIAGGKAMLLVKLGGLLLLYPILFAYFEWLRKDWYAETWEQSLGTHLAIAAAVLGLDASVCASRVFHDEIRWQTMSALLTLPRSIEYVAYSKVAGCLLSVLPTTAFLVVDASLLPPDGPGNVISAVSHPAFWTFLLVISTFLHMVALLSLFVKWGALPLAFMLTIMTFYCGSCLFILPFALAGAGNDGAVVVGILILLVLWAVSSFVFQMMIHARLYELGSK